MATRCPDCEITHESARCDTPYLLALFRTFTYPEVYAGIILNDYPPIGYACRYGSETVLRAQFPKIPESTYRGWLSNVLKGRVFGSTIREVIETRSL